MEKNKQEFIEMVGAWAKKDMEVSGVLASITICLLYTSPSPRD